jgi:hypothetical protein
MTRGPEFCSLCSSRRAHPSLGSTPAAGDIAGCDSTGDEMTADLLDGLDGTVLALGDLAYPSGTADEIRHVLRPVLGTTPFPHLAGPRQPRV